MALLVIDKRSRDVDAIQTHRIREIRKSPRKAFYGSTFHITQVQRTRVFNVAERSQEWMYRQLFLVRSLT